MPMRQNTARDRPKNSSVVVAEVARFDALAPDWWDESGPMRALHWLNPPRLAFIRDALAAHFGRDPAQPQPLAGLRILDIGCGAGLLTEPLARMGAIVTGVDAAAAALNVARHHARTQDLTINYRQTQAEDLVAAGESFDAICALELIEHVADPGQFVADVTKLVRPQGMIFFSTLNRTVKSLVLGVAVAEYVLGWAPRGTHDWRKFVKPSELARMLRGHDCTVTQLAGLVFDPRAHEFRLTPDDLAINYLLAAVRS
jgi:2-polyprenyl-6-hydroxyphenyl methylase/3-demethylubiquinone-9 3-methyltransferase